MIGVTNAIFGYDNRPIVSVDRLEVRPGHCLGMFGPNGSGKTTLVRGLAGLLAPLSGSVQRQSELRIGYVQQHRSIELHWPMTALDAASMAVSARTRCGWISREHRRRIVEHLSVLEAIDLADRPFASLSGGQQQRVLLAGALSALPQLLILDEPTDGLDVRSRRILLRVLRDAATRGLATIMISHAIDDIATLSDEVAWFQEADLPGQPTRVELVPVDELVRRVMNMRQSA
jgi:ABC-type Mn2+/Zn2+ transport system ATPase subunit